MQNTENNSEKYWIILYSHDCDGSRHSTPYHEFTGTEEEARKFAKNYVDLYGSYRLVDVTDAYWAPWN